MNKDTLAQLLLFFAGLNAFIGAAAAKLDPIYFIAGLGTAALFYFARKALLNDRESMFKIILDKFVKGR